MRHARLSPSKADLWMTCPGGIPFAEQNRDRLPHKGEAPAGPAAAAGTTAHEYAEMRILENLHPEEEARQFHRDAANELRLTMDSALIQNAEIYASWAVKFVMTRPNIPWGVELSAPLWYEPESKGTADFWAVDGDTLVVVDYKSGRVRVEVENNMQIAIYLLAIYDEIKAFNPQIKNFRAGVMQPFCLPKGGTDPVYFDYDLEELARMRLAISAGANEVKNPLAGAHRLVTSEKGCRWCPAKLVCPAQNAAVEEFAGLVEEEPEALDGGTLFRLVENLPIVKGFISTIEEYIQKLDEETLSANGFHKKQGARRRTWGRPDEEIKQTLEELGVEPYTQSLKSPAQALKEADEEALKELINVDYNKPKIVSVRKRPATFRVDK